MKVPKLVSPLHPWASQITLTVWDWQDQMGTWMEKKVHV